MSENLFPRGNRMLSILKFLDKIIGWLRKNSRTASSGSLYLFILRQTDVFEMSMKRLVFRISTKRIINY